MSGGNVRSAQAKAVRRQREPRPLLAVRVPALNMPKGMRVQVCESCIRAILQAYADLAAAQRAEPETQQGRPADRPADYPQ